MLKIIPKSTKFVVYLLCVAFLSQVESRVACMSHILRVGPGGHVYLETSFEKAEYQDLR